MKIVVLDGDLVNPGDISWQPLDRLGDIAYYPGTKPDEVAHRIQDAEAILVNRIPVGAAEMDAASALRYIGVFATGYNLIDLAAASARGITVTNAPNYSTGAVAQHTMALLLCITNNVYAFDAAVKQGGWANALHLPMLGLGGKTMGIIGFGTIGRAVGRVARALGMGVIAAGSRPTAEGREIGEYVSLDELYARADVISLHCPLTEATRGIINAESLAKCKPGAILLNTARGGLVVEADLAAALHSGHIRAAGVDVTDPEPLADGSPLKNAPNVLITPHIAWAPPETRQSLVNLVAENLAAYQKGEKKNVVK